MRTSDSSTSPRLHRCTVRVRRESSNLQGSAVRLGRPVAFSSETQEGKRTFRLAALHQIKPRSNPGDQVLRQARRLQALYSSIELARSSRGTARWPTTMSRTFPLFPR